ncbi:hypothetical protein KIPB_011814, partial [Kipferlia bialata]|eukprot:g11814.t1
MSGPADIIACNELDGLRRRWTDLLDEGVRRDMWGQ